MKTEKLWFTNHVQELRRDVSIDCSFDPDIPERCMKADDTFQQESDINWIMKRYQQTGILPETRNKIAQYVDCTELPDLKQYYDIMDQAQDAFDSLPSQLRRKLENDPTKLFDYLQDESNRSELEGYGLLNKREQLNERDNSIPQTLPQT